MRDYRNARLNKHIHFWFGFNSIAHYREWAAIIGYRPTKSRRRHK